jgi:hypothetical protein
MNVAISSDREKMEIFIPYSTYYSALNFSKEEMPNSMFLMEHAVVGLFKEKLIEDYKYGPSEHLKERFPEADEAGILFEPSMLGVELFMWAYGLGQNQNNDFFLPEIKFDNKLDIKLGMTKKNKLNPQANTYGAIFNCLH